MLEDLFECTHKPEVAISEGGQIVEWRCACGERRFSVEERNESNEPRRL
jgi:hypothetical protein